MENYDPKEANKQTKRLSEQINWFKSYPCESQLILMANISHAEEDIFKSSMLGKVILRFTLSGIICPLVLCQTQPSNVSFFIIMSESDMKRGTLFTHEKCELSICGCPLSVCWRGSPDLLLLVEVSKHTPTCRLLLPVHHTEKWWKRWERQRSISPVITHKATDISRRRTSWSAGAGTQDPLLYCPSFFY